MSDQEIEDYHDFFNSIGLADPPIKVVHSTKVSFDARWQATGALTPLADAALDFSGVFRRCQARIAWSAREPASHFAFVSDPASTSYNLVDGPPAIGRERNGVFNP
jgi:hypothetical protein